MNVVSGWILFTLVSLTLISHGQDSRQKHPPSQVDVDKAVALAGGYIEQVCDSDGRFIYRVNIKSGKIDNDYNVIRHAGAIYALSMLQRDKPDQRIADAMVRAASFLGKSYVGPGVRANQLVVRSKPLPQISASNLGATSLGIVALTAVNQVRPGSVPSKKLQELGNFILFAQRKDGSFVNKFGSDGVPVEGFESLYYPGEAALGLISLYETNHSVVWLHAAINALIYLAKSRSSLFEVPPDHWALIATARLLADCPDSLLLNSRSELVRHAVQICQTLMRDQQRATENQSLDGSFDRSGRTTPTATRIEGLLAALEFLPDEMLCAKIRDVVDHGIDFLVRTQIKTGIYAGAMPNAHLAESAEGFYIRIDCVQHALCAWLQYQRMFRPASANSQRDAKRKANLK